VCGTRTTVSHYLKFYSGNETNETLLGCIICVSYLHDLSHDEKPLIQLSQGYDICVSLLVLIKRKFYRTNEAFFVKSLYDLCNIKKVRRLHFIGSRIKIDAATTLCSIEILIHNLKMDKPFISENS